LQPTWAIFFGLESVPFGHQISFQSRFGYTMMSRFRL
jgi:hypothetical protein